VGHSYAARYQVDRKLLSSSDASLYMGKDVSLQRTIFLYQTSGRKGMIPEEYVRRITDVSGVSDQGLLHILDMSPFDQSVFVVLEARSGDPLANLQTEKWTLWKKIELVYNVGKIIQRAAEMRIRGFSVTAENIWISKEGPAIINYWSEADVQNRGKNGIISLLYQLQTDSLEIPIESQEILQDISQSIADESPTVRKKILQTCHSALFDDDSLETVIQNFGDLLSVHRNESHSISQMQMEDRLVQKHVLEHTKERSGKKFHLIGGIALTLSLLALASFAMSLLSADPAPSKPQSLEAAPSRPHEPQRDVQEQEQVQELGSSLAQEKPVAIQQNAQTNPTMIVPDLQNMKKEDAEQTALAHGLHYQYFLDYADYPEGYVYKQNLNAGEPFQKGDTISFWVSKGPVPGSP